MVTILQELLPEPEVFEAVEAVLSFLEDEAADDANSRTQPVHIKTSIELLHAWLKRLEVSRRIDEELRRKHRR